MLLTYPSIKRFIDVASAFLSLIVVAPVLVVLALLIKFDSHGPILFRQKRLGRGGRAFTMYKFRSMHVSAPTTTRSDGSNATAENDPRLTRIGRWLRETSLDELPQLINVIEGDMSLIGPRPDECRHLKLYEPFMFEKLSVRPGMSGLAAVRGRNARPWKQRVKLDIFYVRKISFCLDLYIALRTMAVVMNRRDVYTLRESRPSTARSREPHGGQT